MYHKKILIDAVKNKKNVIIEDIQPYGLNNFYFSYTIN